MAVPKSFQVVKSIPSADFDAALILRSLIKKMVLL